MTSPASLRQLQGFLSLSRLDLMEQSPSQWDALFDIALNIIEKTCQKIGHKFLWSFGGGTALMIQIDHRESHDIDLFIDDPQIMAYLNPLTQGYILSRQPDSYDTDGSRATKLIFDKIGEIDFISCADITPHPSSKVEVRGHTIDLESPAEIVAKKIYYRGGCLQPRDMFDVSAVAERYGTAYVVDAIRECGTERLQSALAVTRNASPEFIAQINSQLMYRPHTAHLIEKAQPITESLLISALT